MRFNLTKEFLEQVHIAIQSNDFEWIDKNVLELQADPTYNDTKPLSLDQAKDYLHKRQSYQAQNDVQRAYKLAKQDEVSRKANQGWMSGFKQITM